MKKFAFAFFTAMLIGTTAYADMIIDNAGIGSINREDSIITTKSGVGYKVNPNYNGIQYYDKLYKGQPCVICNAYSRTHFFIKAFGDPSFKFEDDEIYVVTFRSNRTESSGPNGVNEYLCHKGTVYYRIHNKEIYFSVDPYLCIDLYLDKSPENVDIKSDKRFANFSDLKWTPLSAGKAAIVGGWNYIIEQKNRVKK